MTERWARANFALREASLPFMLFILKRHPRPFPSAGVSENEELAVNGDLVEHKERLTVIISSGLLLGEVPNQQGFLWQTTRGRRSEDDSTHPCD